MTRPASPPGSTPVSGLVALLDLERIELDVFRGQQPQDDTRQRVFGGQVAGQALVAAGRTVPEDRPVHSLHAYFLRPGDPSIPIVYTVDRIRDGRSFTTRRVVALQHGKAIFNLQASFQRDEEGFEHQDAAPDVPGPEDLASMQDVLQEVRGEAHEFWSSRSPVEARPVTPPSQVVRHRGGPGHETARLWMRTRDRLPDDPLVHVCALTYASDATLLDAVLVRHGMTWEQDLVAGASLDHAMWFHRPIRADEWFLYDQHSSWAGGGRGLARGAIYDTHGRRLASVVQEGLLRVAR